jgi:cell cycle checkpoint protein
MDRQVIENIYSLRYSPQKIEELAVHRNKVKEVREWIEASFNQIHQTRLLILQGPPSCGKKSTIRMLSKELHFVIVEYNQPFNENILYKNMQLFSQSVNESFNEFIRKSIKYPLVVTEKKKKVLMLNEINCKKNTQWFEWLKGKNFDGICIIISNESLDLSKVNNIPSFVINFNPVAPTIMTKLLNKIIIAEGIQKSKNIVEKIVEISNGDIRNAINSLQFQMVVKQRGNSLECFSGGRDVTIDIFHCLGRVFYPKKDENGLYIHDPEEIISMDINSSIDNDTFVLFLHQNYPTFASEYNLEFLAESFSFYDSINDFKFNLHDLPLHINVFKILIYRLEQ